MRTLTTEFNGKLVTVTLFEHTCKVCKETYEDSIDMEHICVDCDNEFAEWIEEMGFVVGEFDDRHHPNFVPEPFKGTKWEALED